LRQAYDYWQDQPGNFFYLTKPKEQQQIEYHHKMNAAKSFLELKRLISIECTQKAALMARS